MSQPAPGLTFVSERLTPVGTGFFLPPAVGEPALPRQFSWRKQTVTVAAVFRRWKGYDSDRTHGSGEKYLRRHWYELRMDDATVWTLYFQRQPCSLKSAKARWWLYGIQSPTMNPETSPAAVVQRQLDAYNARDVDALVAIYADDARLYEHPDKLVAQGTAALRARFSQRFTEPNLHAALLNRIVSGHRVIDHERVTRTFPEGPGEIELVMIYEVVDGRIAQAWSIIGPRSRRAEGPRTS